jgi:hypothetical protein
MVAAAAIRSAANQPEPEPPHSPAKRAKLEPTIPLQTLETRDVSREVRHLENVHLDGSSWEMGWIKKMVPNRINKLGKRYI